MSERRNEKGFTMVELLIVMAIIVILGAIAIAQFSAYRQDGFNARASADLRNAATAEEAYYAMQQTFLSCSGTCSSLPGYSHSDGVVITMIGQASSFTGTASHPRGTTTYTWDSAAGGLQ